MNKNYQKCEADFVIGRDGFEIAVFPKCWRKCRKMGDWEKMERRFPKNLTRCCGLIFWMIDIWYAFWETYFGADDVGRLPKLFLKKAKSLVVLCFGARNMAKKFSICVLFGKLREVKKVGFEQGFPA